MVRMWQRSRQRRTAPAPSARRQPMTFLLRRMGDQARIEALNPMRVSVSCPGPHRSTRAAPQGGWLVLHPPCMSDTRRDVQRREGGVRSPRGSNPTAGLPIPDRGDKPGMPSSGVRVSEILALAAQHQTEKGSLQISRKSARPPSNEASSRRKDNARIRAPMAR
jgi:hypothetical protein